MRKTKPRPTQKKIDYLTEKRKLLEQNPSLNNSSDKSEQIINTKSCDLKFFKGNSRRNIGLRTKNTSRDSLSKIKTLNNSKSS